MTKQGTDMRRRVAITGLGAITPLGATARESWGGVRQGACGIAPITAYDASGQAAKLAGEVRVDLKGLVAPADVRKQDRFTLLALVAAKEAFADSGITAENTALDRVDTLIGSGIGGLATTVREHVRAEERGYDRSSPFFIPTTIANMAAGRVAIELGLTGDSSCTVTACASSAHALGEAMRHIRHGYADAVLAGGAEACVIPLAMGGFTSMQALHTGSCVERASIPFDAERSGFVLGEGAGMLVLEEWEHARRRGAHIYAELAGFGAACDAYHITAPAPDGSGAIRAMTRAIADAGLVPGDIGYLNAHGTSTPLNDKGEVSAAKAVFGENSVPPLSSTKSMTGHLLGAAGAVEALFCAYAIAEGFIPATIHYQVPDPDCDLDVVPNEGRTCPVAHALSNSLGFGGHNASLVISRTG
ncbi:MAG: beta-ketoacyl-ACP synthase II [Coriobacteriales bacterium]|jgi:3-oxoacyl-[acyl-carrier-protein] synthase II|nr:beta-ketoacyl-ACP synthase II [Coriobacteriales bacterium]